MKVIVHFPSLHDAPEGIWWLADGSLESYYTDPDLKRTGEYQMRWVHGQPPASVSEIFDNLSARTSYDQVWETATLTDKMTPQQFLSHLQKRAKSEIRQRDSK